MAEDYKEEQANEIDALISIYGDEIDVISDDPYCVQIKITQTVNDEANDNIEAFTVAAELQFTLEGEYPNNVPMIDIISEENFEDTDKDNLKKTLMEESENNIGMVMIFTLVSAAQEFINGMYDKLQDKQRKEKEILERKRKEEEEKKFHGTPVTVETFTAWRIKFEEEFCIPRQRIEEESRIQPKRLTGRQLFEQDATLKDSDAQFFADGGVEVDESLFQDLGDLDLEEELE